MSPIETGLFSPRYAALPPIFYRVVAPQPLDAPHWAAISPDCAQLLGLNPATDFNDASLAVLAGQRPPAAHPALATAYSGHQFGVWAGQLGDGRALLLGERQGRDGQRYEVQIKGGGLTPFSRMGDGRAVLRSSIREFLCSEAMAGLGIPTSRALALVASRTPVQRESWETAAVVTRVAPSFVRFGMFEHFCHGNRPDALRQLADHVIAAHFAHCRDAPQPYLAWFTEVIAASARLAADWQAVGFCHGVLNTDNMSILGLTLDYGPFGFLDGFDPEHICNHSDHHGRYSYRRQPYIVQWNLQRLAAALWPLIREPELLAALEGYQAAYEAALAERMRAKLGLLAWRDSDWGLLTDLLDVMAEARADYTLTWRRLCAVRADGGDPLGVRDLFIDRAAFDAWRARYAARLREDGQDDDVRASAMRAVNPAYVLRNHLAEQAIQAAQQGDYQPIERLRAALADPYRERPADADLAVLPPDWAQTLSVSCSS